MVPPTVGFNGAIVFSVVFTTPPSQHGSVWLLPVISLLLTSTVSPVRACLYILLDRFRGNQKEDERGPLSTVYYYVPETHIMYFIQRCWFLKCSEEIHYVPIGAGNMWYYVPVDDGWEEVLGCNVYITSQYFSPNAKYWTTSSGNRTRAPPW